MAEDFTTYTEVDPNGRITVTAARVTWASLSRNEDAYVYYDKGAGYYSGDFTMYFTHRTTAETASGTRTVGCWAVTNTVDDLAAIVAANGDYLAIRCGKTLGGAYTLRMTECDGGAEYTGGDVTISLNTDYYLKVKRDEAVGTYGTIYMEIYTDAARALLLSTTSIALHTSKKDYRYLFPVITSNSGDAGIIHSGYTDSLVSLIPVTYPSDPIVRITGLVHRYSPGNYTLEVFLGDTRTDWDYLKPDVSEKPAETLAKPKLLPETLRAVPPGSVPKPPLVYNPTVAPAFVPGSFTAVTGSTARPPLKDITTIRANTPTVTPKFIPSTFTPVTGKTNKPPLKNITAIKKTTKTDKYGKTRSSGIQYEA